MIKSLEEHLQNYFGMLTTIRMVGRPDQIVEKPAELTLCEMLDETGLPIWAGGLMDQPHIWLQMVGVVRNVRRLFEALQRRAENANAVQSGPRDNSS